MEQVINATASVFVEIFVVIIGALAISLLHKAQAYIHGLKKKNDLGIIDVVTDRVVEYAEAQLKGDAGKAKRDFAVQEAVKILASKGIVVDEAEIIAGVENGVTKLKMNQGFLTPFQSDGINNFR